MQDFRLLSSRVSEFKYKLLLVPAEVRLNKWKRVKQEDKENIKVEGTEGRGKYSS
jgi:hypothetical protein